MLNSLQEKITHASSDTLAMYMMVEVVSPVDNGSVCILPWSGHCNSPWLILSLKSHRTITSIILTEALRRESPSTAKKKRFLLTKIH